MGSRYTGEDRITKRVKKYSKKEEMIMSVTAIKSFPASSYMTIPMQENSAYSGERQSGTADEKKTNTKQKKENGDWKEAISVFLYTSEGTAGRSAGTSSYGKIRHMVYKQNMLERRSKLLKDSKPSMSERAKTEEHAVEAQQTEENVTVDTKQQKQMEEAVKKYVVSETYIRLPDATNQGDGVSGITALFGNYNVDKTYRVKLATVNVQC